MNSNYRLWDRLEVWHTPDVYPLFELLQGIQHIRLHPTKVPANDMFQLWPGGGKA